MKSKEQQFNAELDKFMEEQFNKPVRTNPIKEKRLEIGMSRAEMSRRFEIPIRTLENWDAGINQPAPWIEKLILEKLDTMKKDC